MTVNFIFLLEATLLIIFKKLEGRITDDDKNQIRQISYSITFSLFVEIGMIYSASVFGNTLA
jgi:hypothetical protein